MTDEKIKSVAYQYYYKVDGCKANDADADDCICWHPEGLGPNQKERHDSDTPLVLWRKLYPESALLQAREEGRREGMQEAAEIAKSKHDGLTSMGAKDLAATCAMVYTAITRAAEGK